MIVKKGNTYFQKKDRRGMDPILLRVIKVIDTGFASPTVCKVRWHVLGKNKVFTAVFPMATIREGEFAGFVPIPHKVYREAIDILKTVDDYKSAKRRVLYRMKYTIMCKNITV